MKPFTVLISDLFLSFKRSSLIKKVVLGYIFIIFIPNLAFCMLFYFQYNNKMLNDYVNNKQKLIQQSYNYLKSDLSRVSSVYQLFHSNSGFFEYLSGYPQSEGEYVYNFLKNIKPLFNYVYSGIPLISNIKIFKINSEVFPIGSEIVEFNKLKETTLNKIKLSPIKGIWIYKPTTVSTLPEIKYYQNIYDLNYSKKLGVIEISVKDILMNDFLKTIKSSSPNKSTIFLLSNENKILYGVKSENFNLSTDEVKNIIQVQDKFPSKILKINGKKVIVNLLKIQDLNVSVLIIEDAIEVFKSETNKIYFYTGTLLFLLLLLSILYYHIFSTITTRIIGLVNHMKNVGKDNLSEYNTKIQRYDEIGMLINSYNLMIQRIDELVFKVHQEEILRKEAAYSALQAQIKPHFLYGTLETIRMLADFNGDAEVANIAFTFGRLMRYTLSNNKNEVTLKDELENMKNYLDIYKIRLEDRLEYTIDINVGIEGFLCPQFILQPLAENCIHHGISRITKKGIINIDISETETHIVVTIRDNGLGITPERLRSIRAMLNNDVEIKAFQTNESGFGLYNINERLKFYFGPNSVLTINSQYGMGTVCILSLAKKSLLD